MKRLYMYICSFFIIVGTICMLDVCTIQAQDKLEIKVKRNLNLKFSDCEVLSVRVYYNGEDVTDDDDLQLSFKNSNKSVIGIETDSNFKDLVSIDTKKQGKSTITINAKYRELLDWDNMEFDGIYGETICAIAKCNVTVKYYTSLRVEADLFKYDTRSNTFSISVQNLSNKSIKILSKGAMAYDDDYKKFDRKVYIKGKKSSVTIKPRQSKIIKFKVKGKRTWYDYNDFQICSYWKWGNKKYWVSVMPDEAWRKAGKKWKQIGYSE